MVWESFRIAERKCTALGFSRKALVTNVSDMRCSHSIIVLLPTGSRAQESVFNFVIDEMSYMIHNKVVVFA